jgi:hypothetical protein
MFCVIKRGGKNNVDYEGDFGQIVKKDSNGSHAWVALIPRRTQENENN